MLSNWYVDDLSDLIHRDIQALRSQFLFNLPQLVRLFGLYLSRIDLHPVSADGISKDAFQAIDQPVRRLDLVPTLEPIDDARML